MKKKKNIGLIIAVLSVIALIILIVLALKFGWSENIININIKGLPEGAKPSDIEKTPQDKSCTFSFDKSTACVGELVEGEINDGSLKSCVVAYNYEGNGWKIYNVETLDINGEVTQTASADVSGTYIFTALCGYFEGTRFIAECRTNDAKIEIIECDECTDTDGGDNKDIAGHITFRGDTYYDYCLDDDPVYDLYEYYCVDNDWVGHKVSCDVDQECIQTRSGGYCADKSGYELGDIVEEDSVSGDMQGGIGVPIDLSDVETGGNCYLGIRIWTDWGYVTPSLCQGILGVQGVIWEFYDSSGLRWSRIDATPRSDYEEICPCSWDGQNIWHIEMSQIHPYPDCIIGYDLDYEVFVCECD